MGGGAGVVEVSLPTPGTQHRPLLPCPHLLPGWGDSQQGGVGVVRGASEQGTGGAWVALSSASCRLSWEDTGWGGGGARRGRTQSPLLKAGLPPACPHVCSWVSGNVGDQSAEEARTQPGGSQDESCSCQGRLGPESTWSRKDALSPACHVAQSK